MVMALYEGTLTNLIDIYEDTTGPHPDTRPVKPNAHYQPFYVWFCFRNHPDIARERVWQQRWNSLTYQQQVAIRDQRWGGPADPAREAAITARRLAEARAAHENSIVQPA